MSMLEELQLSANHLSGGLPKSIGLLTRLHELSLYINQLSGRIPTSLGELSSLFKLDVSYNSLDGVLSEIHFMKLNNLVVLDLSENLIMFNVSPHWIPLFQLNYFRACSCNVGPQFPNWLQTSTYIIDIHFSNSGIRDSIPQWFENITFHLGFLDLSENKIGGNLPRMRNPGDIPSWIGKKLSKLRILNLQSNNFMGKIPPELCQNNALQHLNLANNNISGMIPHCIYNLTGMIVTSVDFQYYASPYEENIESYIKALNNLNLSRNLLSGQIPTRIGNLNKLESLDFSMNLLSGGIPPSLATLNFLSYLNLSFNNLSGQIPFGNQLQTLGDPLAIYGGNNELCGPILVRSCNKKNLSDTHVSDKDGNNEIQDF
uniref:probable LRR receptor-like serine/threonine-protein kinase At1g12460 n=1 Tax=Erigeron canadensis TaxID=72917 RepID=UPI001CB8BFD1|nr:probable LRR receptor-like serine/threonine-protein kinase At1g12460 [Erigeron canadensis]